MKKKYTLEIELNELKCKCCHLLSAEYVPGTLSYNYWCLGRNSFVRAKEKDENIALEELERQCPLREVEE